MPASGLRAHIQDLAAAFAVNVLSTLRGASLEDILSESRGGVLRRGPGRPPKTATPAAPKRKKATKGRLARRSPEQIKAALDGVVALLKKSPDQRAEQIRDALGMDRREMPRVLAQGLADRVLAKKGEKRATTYRTK